MGESHKGGGVEAIAMGVRDFALGWNHTIILKGGLLFIS
jgi:hypothetical protein